MSDEQWLSHEQLAAWRKMIAVVERLPNILETQLQRDSAMSHFEYFTLAMLSEAKDRKLRITELALKTNATVARLSHVLSRLEKRGLVRREPCPHDGRATNAALTAAGWDAVVAAAPHHVHTVRDTVMRPLTKADVADLDRIMGAILSRMDGGGRT
ncbi:MarR family winged helix-turn-helix transcriptional regulator [Tessaracoccus antarcticus]|uniref:MarR family transcriptional regulator n=1 Tax=Tessaracoccus antarcticus TaxID=2479848 RepID=A0A3M0GF69_9ACTN|nr:MarR family transcriptional regulator [Tessaracoccus antarcticus]RMB61302.1 MarR family transcriptional regulator [Tessaracoccus antarcticus]